MMRNANGQSTWMVALNATLLGLASVLTLGCGSKVTQPVGGETGFLEACGSDADCASELCACGVCTRVCETSSECGNDAKCTAEAAGPACSGELRSICVAATTSSDDATGVTTSTNDGQTTAVGSEGCYGPGHYEAGKGGEYRPCCEGLTEVLQLGAAEGDDGPVCVDLPLRIYACVEGSCGDGVCEVGEDVHCGCVDDCPGAAWESVDADASVSCDDISCVLDLLPTSSGSVNVRVEFQDEFCAPEIWGSAITLHHAASDMLVPRDSVHSCEDDCPRTPPPVAPTTNTDPFTWDGHVTVADAIDACESGQQMPCQAEKVFAPPGKYVARLCSKPAELTAEGEAMCRTSDAADVCSEVEFDYPQVEDVVIPFTNPARPFTPTVDGTNSGSTSAVSSGPAASIMDAGAIQAASDAALDGGS